MLQDVWQKPGKRCCADTKQYICKFLFKLLQDNINIKNLDSISDEMLKEYLVFSNYYATYSTTKKGAIGSYATLDEITKYMNK